MNNMIEYLLDVLKQQGLSFLLLALGVWIAYEKVQEQDAKINRLQSDVIECNERIIQYYQDNQAMLIRAMDRNTAALREVVEGRD